MPGARNVTRPSRASTRFSRNGNRSRISCGQFTPVPSCFSSSLCDCTKFSDGRVHHDLADGVAAEQRAPLQRRDPSAGIVGERRARRRARRTFTIARSAKRVAAAPASSARSRSRCRGTRPCPASCAIDVALDDGDGAAEARRQSTQTRPRCRRSIKQCGGYACDACRPTVASARATGSPRVVARMLLLRACAEPPSRRAVGRREGMFDDDALPLAAALAYYSLLSMAPLLLVVVAIAGVFFADGQVQAQLIEQMRQPRRRGGRGAHARPSSRTPAARSAARWSLADSARC